MNIPMESPEEGGSNFVCRLNTSHPQLNSRSSSNQFTCRILTARPSKKELPSPATPKRSSSREPTAPDQYHQETPGNVKMVSSNSEPQFTCRILTARPSKKELPSPATPKRSSSREPIAPDRFQKEVSASVTFSRSKSKLRNRATFARRPHSIKSTTPKCTIPLSASDSHVTSFPEQLPGTQPGMSRSLVKKRLCESKNRSLDDMRSLRQIKTPGKSFSSIEANTLRGQPTQCVGSMGMPGISFTQKSQYSSMSSSQSSNSSVSPKLTPRSYSDIPRKSSKRVQNEKLRKLKSRTTMLRSLGVQDGSRCRIRSGGRLLLKSLPESELSLKRRGATYKKSPFSHTDGHKMRCAAKALAREPASGIDDECKRGSSTPLHQEIKQLRALGITSRR